MDVQELNAQPHRTDKSSPSAQPHGCAGAEFSTPIVQIVITTCSTTWMCRSCVPAPRHSWKIPPTQPHRCARAAFPAPRSSNKAPQRRDPISPILYDALMEQATLVTDRLKPGVPALGRLCACCTTTHRLLATQARRSKAAQPGTYKKRRPGGCPKTRRHRTIKPPRPIKHASALI